MTVSNGLRFPARLNPTKWVAALAVVLAMAATLAGQTVARSNRITQGVTAGGLVTVHGTVHRLAKQATDMGQVSSQVQMESMSLSTNLSAAQQKELDTLLAEQQDPQSPLYHKWLTQEEFGARFGLTDADLSTVTAWLTSQGFTVTSVSRSRNSVRFSGKVWQVESAFHTQMHVLQLNGETHIANTTELQVPAGLASVLLNVRGLNNFRPKPRIRRSQQPATTLESSGGTYYNFLSPADWATIYDVSPIYSQTCGTSLCDGTGMHVGVVGQTYIYPSDILNFRTAAGLSTTNTYLHTVCVDTTTSRCTGTSSISTTGDLSEADMDIEWAGGIAKNATVDYIYAPYEDACSNSACTSSVADPNTNFGSYSTFDALEHAVEDCRTVSGTTVCDTSASAGSVIPVISMSYGDCESDYAAYPSVGNVNWILWIGKQANAQGQTLLTSSGDSGPFTCDYNTYPAASGVWADIPADSPNFTGVGGTTLSGDEGIASTYWYETNGLVSSAKQYIPETAWNDTAALVAAGYNDLAATGGTVSQHVSQPTWQNGLVSTQTIYRMVPDVAFAASADHDGYLICSTDDNSSNYGTDCASGFVSSLNKFGGNVWGGTSASSPSFAGMLTLIVQKYGNQGNINPTLYALAAKSANYSTIFHAPTGNNITPCTVETGDTGCTGTTGSTSSFGYTVPSSFPYYSMATGLGSIDGYQLFQALGGAATTTVLNLSSNSVVLNGTVTLTAQVSPSVTNSLTPSGTVTFYVGSTSLGTGNLSSNTATLSNVAVTTAKGFTVGSDSITASYGGDSNFTSSTSAASTLTVTALPATTTTVTANTPSIALGSSIATASYTATVTAGSGTPAGTVVFTVGSVTVGSGTLNSGNVTVSVAPTTANGFTVGSDSVTATFTPTSGANYGSSSGTTTQTVTAPAYTITPSVTSVTLAAGGSQTLTFTVATTTFADTTTVTGTTSSSLITVSPAISIMALPKNSTGAPITMTITASASAANHAPRMPWSGGVIAFGVVLAGIPLARRRKRVAAVLLVALAISTLGFMMACGGSGSSGGTKAARTYTVTLTGTGGITSVVTVTVQ